MDVLKDQVTGRLGIKCSCNVWRFSLSTVSSYYMKGISYGILLGLSFFRSSFKRARPALAILGTDLRNESEASKPGESEAKTEAALLFALAWTLHFISLRSSHRQHFLEASSDGYSGYILESTL